MEDADTVFTEKMRRVKGLIKGARESTNGPQR
jgi:hypothetical protein